MARLPMKYTFLYLKKNAEGALNRSVIPQRLCRPSIRAFPQVAAAGLFWHLVK
jgi:hypothetical protein